MLYNEQLKNHLIKLKIKMLRASFHKPPFLKDFTFLIPRPYNKLYFIMIIIT